MRSPLQRVRRTPVLAGLPVEVGVIAAIAFFVALGFGIVAPAIPIYASTFGVSAFLAGAVISVFALMRFVSSPGAGALVDRLGERVVLTTGLLIVGVSSVLAGLAQSYVQLLVLRGAGGLGSSMFTVSAMAMMLKVVRPDQRGRAAGAFQAGFLLGAVAGPAVGGLVVGISIRAPFFFYAATLLAAAYVSWNHLPAEPPGQPIERAVDAASGAEADATTAASDDTTTVDGAGAGAGADRDAAAAGGWDAAAAGGARADVDGDEAAAGGGDAAGAGRSIPAAPTLGQALRMRSYHAALAANFTNGTVIYGLRSSLVPLFVVDALHGSPSLSGIGFLFTAFTEAVLLLPAGRLADRRGRRPALLSGTILTVVGMTGLALSGATWPFLLAMAVCGLAAAFMGSAPAAVAGDVVGASGRGIVIAVYQMTADLGAIVGPLLAGLLADTIGFTAAFGVGAGFALVALAFAAVMPETLRPSAPEPSR